MMQELNQQAGSNGNADGPKEACGVFGIYAPELDVSRITFFAMVALQHRGQESCGIATCEESGQMHRHTGMGLVNQAFVEENLKPLVGNKAIGHTRYSTAGSSTLENAQPVIVQTLRGAVAIAQNGNLVHANRLRQQLLAKGVGMFKDSDVEIITQMMAANWKGENPNWIERLSAFMEKADGAYSLAVMTSDAIYGLRDYLGMRPLCIGTIDVTAADGSKKKRYMIASESCAINTVGGTYLREVMAGEIVRIDENGLASFEGRKPAAAPAFCIFEYVYFARPDTIFEGQLIHSVRQRFGEQLAVESPPPAGADCVIGVPDSSLPMAIGYAKQAKLEYTEGFIKNRYIYRTFIQPTKALRKQGVALKFNPLSQNINGKNVVLVDDSIVRGTTLQSLVELIRSAGAKEVHVRISSPPVKHPCYMGIDMATPEQLIGHNKTVDEIRDFIKADSLAYLSHDGMVTAVRQGLKEAGSGNYCSACFTGNYPLDINDW
jgi:amidophosphoribosyltransferase